MKKIRIQSVLVAALLAATLCAPAQTTTPTGQTTTPAMPPISLDKLTGVGISSNTQVTIADVGGSILGALKDAQPYLSNGVYTIEMGGLYNSAAKNGRFGAFFDVQVPIAGQASIGLGTAYQDSQWLEGSVSARVGTTVNWTKSIPLVGGWIGPVYAYVESGPSYNLKTHAIGSYNFAGFIKRWDISKKFELTAGGAVGNISSIPGTDYAFGASLTYHK